MCLVCVYTCGVFEVCGNQSLCLVKAFVCSCCTQQHGPGVGVLDSGCPGAAKSGHRSKREQMAGCLLALQKYQEGDENIRGHSHSTYSEMESPWTGVVLLARGYASTRAREATQSLAVRVHGTSRTNVCLSALDTRCDVEILSF